MKVYVGTYGKYNRGSLDGAWLDLSNYSDYDEFLEAAQALHVDEHDPELMYQDWEAPDWAIDEYGVSRECWDYMELDEEKKKIADHLLEDHGATLGAVLDRIEDLGMYIYTGSLESWSLDNFLDLHSVDESVMGYLDYEKIARDDILSGVAEIMGDYRNPCNHTRSDCVSWLIGRN